MDTPKAPWPTGRIAHSNLTGCVFPVQGEHLALIAATGSPHLYMPVFSDVDDMRAMMARLDIPFDGVKQIQEHDSFIASVPRSVGEQDLKIIVDLEVTPQGTFRWLEIPG